MGRGAFIVLVGPDGAGKTSVATELLARTGGEYFHFRPPLFRRWDTPLAGETTAHTPPVRRGPVFSALRLTKAFVTFWAGYLTSVRPEVRAARIVIADRWAYGYLVHPIRLGVSIGTRWTNLLVRALPQPEMVFALVAEPRLIHRRKQELSPQQVAEEVAAWASLPVPQLSHVDASLPIPAIVDGIMSHLEKS